MALWKNSLPKNTDTPVDGVYVIPNFVQNLLKEDPETVLKQLFAVSVHNGKKPLKSEPKKPCAVRGDDCVEIWAPTSP